MKTAFTKKIAAAALAVSTLAGTGFMTMSAGIGTVVAVSALSATPAEAAGQCGPRVSVHGAEARGLVYALRKERAERRAKRAWRAFVAGQSGTLAGSFNSTSHPAFGLGTRYADLDNAKNVSMNCTGSGSAKMYCTVTAIPCPPGGTIASAKPRSTVAAPKPRTQFEYTGPDIKTEVWNSDFGPIHWNNGNGWYGDKSKRLTGSLFKNRDGQYVFQGHWSRTNSSARGEVLFVFDNHKSFRGQYRSTDGTMKPWNGSK